MPRKLKPTLTSLSVHQGGRLLRRSFPPTGVFTMPPSGLWQSIPSGASLRFRHGWESLSEFRRTIKMGKKSHLPGTTSILIFVQFVRHTRFSCEPRDLVNLMTSQWVFTSISKALWNTSPAIRYPSCFNPLQSTAILTSRRMKYHVFLPTLGEFGPLSCLMKPEWLQTSSNLAFVGWGTLIDFTWEIPRFFKPSTLPPLTSRPLT